MEGWNRFDFLFFPLITEVFNVTSLKQTSVAKNILFWTKIVQVHRVVTTGEYHVVSFVHWADNMAEENIASNQK